MDRKKKVQQKLELNLEDRPGRATPRHPVTTADDRARKYWERYTRPFDDGPWSYVDLLYDPESVDKQEKTAVFLVSHAGYGEPQPAVLKVVNIFACATDRPYTDKRIRTIYRRSHRECEIMDKVSDISERCAVNIYGHFTLPWQDGSWMGEDLVMLMEYYPLTLENELANSDPLTTEQTIEVGLDLCRDLQLCSQAISKDASFCHRDIKPANIFYDELSGHYILADFGISRILERDEQATTAAGTFRYEAPEVLSGKPYDERADIFSIGKVIDRCLGVKSEGIEATIQKVRFLRNLDSDMGLLKSISEKAQSNQPENRYQTTAELAKALQEARAWIQSNGSGDGGQAGKWAEDGQFAQPSGLNSTKIWGESEGPTVAETRIVPRETTVGYSETYQREEREYQKAAADLIDADSDLKMTLDTSPTHAVKTQAGKVRWSLRKNDVANTRVVHSPNPADVQETKSVVYSKEDSTTDNSTAPNSGQRGSDPRNSD